MTAPLAKYGTVGTLGKVALNPIVFEPVGVGTFHGPNEKADSTVLIAPLIVPIAPLIVLITLLNTDTTVSLIFANVSTTVSLALENLSTIASLIAPTFVVTVFHMFLKVVVVFSRTYFQTPLIFSLRFVNFFVTPSTSALVFPITQSFSFVAASLILSQFLYSKTPIAIAAPTARTKTPPGPIAVAIALIPPMMPPVPVISAISPFAAIAIPDTLLITLDANPAIFAAANAPIRAAPNASTID